MVKLVVRVRDVNGKEYSPPYFVARFKQKGADGETASVLLRLVPGVATDAQSFDDTINLTVGTQGAAFSGETFTIKKVGGNWLSDTPAAAVTAQGDPVQVDVVDGTVRLAPTVYIPPGTRVNTNPKALLCEPGQGWIYYGAYLTNPRISLLKNPIVFATDQPDDYPFDPRDVKNEGAGNFVLLEFGFDVTAVPPERGPRFLVGVWAPRIALGAAPQILVFYTPPTHVGSFPEDRYPFTDAYPYSPFINPPPAAGVVAENLVQSYPYLAVNYLLAGYKIVPQLLAAGRNPIVVFPVRPTGGWGPLGTQAGAGRLLREVVRFLYARQIVSSRSAPPAHLSLVSGRGSVTPASGVFTNEPIPASWTLTVSGFSNGIDRVLDLCTPIPIDDKAYNPDVFASPEAAFTDSWREIWDIDGVADDGKGAARHLNSLRDWLKVDRRRVRSYHSDSGMRTAPKDLVAAARIISRPSPPYKGLYIDEGTSADDKATWVHFSDIALQKSVYDAHHTVPAIAFGHAAQFPLP